jgi:hypothetical protein
MIDEGDKTAGPGDGNNGVFQLGINSGLALGDFFSDDINAMTATKNRSTSCSPAA